MKFCVNCVSCSGKLLDANDMCYNKFTTSEGMKNILREISIRHFFSQFKKRAVLTFVFSVLLLTFGVALVAFLYGEQRVKAISYIDGTIKTGPSDGTEEIINNNVEVSGTVEFNRHITINGNLTLKPNSILTHAQQGFLGGVEGMYLTVNGTIILERNARIDASGKGYKGGSTIFIKQRFWSYYFKVSQFIPSSGSAPGIVDWNENRGGKGGDWVSGGTGGGSGTRTANRGGIPGGGGGAYGFGSGGKTNHTFSGPGCMGGGGAGYHGTGGAWACSKSANNGSTNTSAVFDNGMKFGGGGGSGFANVNNDCSCFGGNAAISVDDVNEAFTGGNGGGIVSIKANAIIMGANAQILAKGTAGGKALRDPRLTSLGYTGLEYAYFSAGGGGGTIKIDTDNLEILNPSGVVFDVSGGNGWGTGDTRYYATSGAGGGGVNMIDVSTSLKIGGGYQTNMSFKLTPMTRETGGEIKNVNDEKTMGSPVPILAFGGDGKEVLIGNPTNPITACDLSKIILTDPAFTSQPGATPHYKKGDIIIYQARYNSQDNNSNCSGEYELHFQTNINNQLYFDNVNKSKLTPGDLQPITQSVQGLDAEYWVVSSPGIYTGEIKVRIKDNACENPVGIENKIQIYQKHMWAGKTTNIINSDNHIIVDCPNLNIENEVGAGGDITNSASNLKFIGSSVISRSGTTAINKDTNVIDLSNRTHSFDFNATEANFEELKKQRAKNLTGTGVFNLNSDNKPEGGVWRMADGVATLDKIFEKNSHGTIFYDGDLTINKIEWNASASGTLGIVVKNGSVTIKDKNLKNVAIYAYGDEKHADKGKIIFGYSDDGVDASGSFVGNSITIGQASGTIKYAPDLNVAPPPGFSSLVKEIQTLE